MNTSITYAQMRRILGLPDVAHRTPSPWAVRKIRTGDDAGLWGVWRQPSGATSERALVGACTTWQDAMDRVGRRPS